MQESQGSLQHVEQGVHGLVHHVPVLLFPENALARLDIDVAEVVHEEVVEGNGGVSEVVVVELGVEVLDGLVQLVQDPFVDKGQVVLEHHGRVEGEFRFEVAQDEFAAVPDFIAELFVANDSLEVEIDVLSLEHVGEESEAEGVRTTLRDALGELPFLLLRAPGHFLRV